MPLEKLYSRRYKSPSQFTNFEKEHILKNVILRLTFCITTGTLNDLECCCDFLHDFVMESCLGTWGKDLRICVSEKEMLFGLWRSSFNFLSKHLIFWYFSVWPYPLFFYIVQDNSGLFLMLYSTHNIFLYQRKSSLFLCILSNATHFKSTIKYQQLLWQYFWLPLIPLITPMSKSLY